MYFRNLIVFALFCLVLTGCSSSDSSTDHNSVSQNNVALTQLSVPATAEEFAAEAEAAIARADQQLQQIIAAEPHTFENTIVAFDTLEYEGYRAADKFRIMAQLMPNATLRDAASSAYLTLAQWYFLALLNPDLLNAVAEVDGTDAFLDGEDLKLLEQVQSEMRNNGSELTETERTTLLQNSIVSEGLKQQIMANITNDAPAADNPPLLAELIRTRAAYAALFGYDSYADYITESLMAKTPESAVGFVQGLSDRLAGKFNAEKQTLQDLKVAETGDPAAQLDFADFSHFRRIYLEERYGVDNPATIKYFSLEKGLETLFTIARQVFGVEIRFVDAPGLVWSDDVRYCVATDVATGTLLGSFYLDLYARDGKNGAERIEKFTSGKTYPDGSRECPLSVLVLDVAKPAEGTAAMISFYALQGLFHEFGHMLKALCSSNRYFSTNSDAWGGDFREIHSQLLEQWLTDPVVLQRVAGTELNLSPQELIDRTADGAFPAIAVRGQIGYAMTDLTLHSQFGADDVIDPVAVFNASLVEYFVPYAGNVDVVKPLSHMASSMPSSYYTYLWSKGIALDLSSSFKASGQGFWDAELGMALRKAIFEPDASRDPQEEIGVFLGRAWNTDAYYDYLGVE